MKKTQFRARPPKVGRSKILDPQALLRNKGVECYRIANLNIWTCRHHFSSTECLLYWWEEEQRWLIVGDGRDLATQLVSKTLYPEEQLQ